MATKKEKIRFNKALLDEVVNRDKCVLVGTYDDKITRETVIIYICGSENCDEQTSKNFRYLYDHGAFCKACTTKNAEIKKKATCMEIFGFEHQMKNADVVKKVETTNIERHGYKNPFESEEIKDMIKQNNIINFGVEYSSQREDVRQKTIETCKERYGHDNPMQNETVQQKLQDTIMQIYNVKNPFQAEVCKEKSRETCKERYGHEYPMQNADIRKKVETTNLERHGVINVSQSEDIKQKIKETWMNNYGTEHPMKNADVFLKMQDTNMERYGKKCIFGVEEFQQKAQNTCIQNFGYPNAMQNPEVAERSMKASSSRKEFTFPCGRMVSVQGYEPLALNILVKNGYQSQDLVIGANEVPEIWYTKDGKSHRYYCDIYIPKENKIIEVKSEWTVQKETGNVEEKAVAAKNDGFEYEIWVLDKNGNNRIIPY